MHKTENRKARLYLAGPLFSLSERKFNEDLTSALSDVFDVFLPQENGCLFVDLVANGMSVREAARKVFLTDIQGIETCDVLLIVLDGRSVDEGAAFELGFAFARNKVCVGLQTDMRRLLPVGNNPMIDSPLSQIFENVESLIYWARCFCTNQSEKVPGEYRS
jgi:nucleoside 2-deoxyribosyltransferase